jgi:hypothetical protein
MIFTTLAAACILSSTFVAGDPPPRDADAGPVDAAEQDGPEMVWMWPSSVTQAEFAPAARGDRRAPGAFEFTREQFSATLKLYGISSYSEFPGRAGELTLQPGAPLLRVHVNGGFSVVNPGVVPSGVFIALGPTRLNLGDQTSIALAAHEMVCVRAIEPVLMPASDAVVIQQWNQDNGDPLPPGWRNAGSVSCQSGYYACCNCDINDGASCHCRKNDEDIVCSEGGVGSQSASIRCQR